jgi:hypothetical protein
VPERDLSERVAIVEAFLAEREKTFLTYQVEMQKKGDERHHYVSDLLEKIFSETRKTNGRVSDLEHWRERFAGAWWIIGVMGAISVGIGGVVGFTINVWMHR